MDGLLDSRREFRTTGLVSPHPPMSAQKASSFLNPLALWRPARGEAGGTKALERAQKTVLCLGLMLLSAASAATDLVPPTKVPAMKGHPGLPLQPLVQIDCPNFGKLATGYQSQFKAPMRNWSVENLGRLGSRKILYPFSGPDVITALALFGSAEHLILVADQTPELNVSAKAETLRIQKECQTQSYFARLGYFRTNDLEGKGSIRPRFTKMLVYSILISGSSIERVVPLRINAQGKSEEIGPNASGPHEGLRFQITTAEGRPVTVDYLRMNLSNAGIKPDSAQRNFLANNMASTVFVKSASHLLQKSTFSVLADLIADRANAVVQDETGLDIDLMNQHFKVAAYGRFNRPHPLWKDSASAMRLKDFLSAQPVLPQLPFVMGYEKPTGSILLVASRRSKLSK